MYGGDGGQATAASFYAFQMHITFDKKGNMFESSYASHYIRFVDGNTGIISTIAGEFLMLLA